MKRWTKVDGIPDIGFAGPVSVVAEEQYGAIKELLLTDGTTLVSIRAGYGSLEVYVPKDESELPVPVETVTAGL